MFQGTVIIIANHGDRIDIPAGANLENKIVSGNLRILDHWAHLKNNVTSTNCHIEHQNLVQKNVYVNNCIVKSCY